MYNTEEYQMSSMYKVDTPAAAAAAT
jgi:hypothetical protein